MEAKSKSTTPILLALILVVLVINLIGTFTPVVMTLVKDLKPKDTTVTDTYYKALGDLAFDRMTGYEDALYKDPSVDNINKQQFRVLEYIWMELNAQTQMNAQYYSSHQ
jgi:hypothetical protein